MKKLITFLLFTLSLQQAYSSSCAMCPDHSCQNPADDFCIDGISFQALAKEVECLRNCSNTSNDDSLAADLDRLSL